MHRAENQAHSECGWKPGDEGVGMDSSRSEPDKWRTKNRKERGRHCLLSKHLAARPPVQAALRLASLGLDGTRPTLQTRSLEEAMPAISCQRVQLRPAWEQKTLDRIGLLMEAATRGSGSIYFAGGRAKSMLRSLLSAVEKARSTRSRETRLRTPCWVM